MGSDFAIISLWLSQRQGELEAVITLEIQGDKVRLCQLVRTKASLCYFLSTGGLFLDIKPFCMMSPCSFRRKKKSANSRDGINLNESALLIRSSEAKTKK